MKISTLVLAAAGALLFAAPAHAQAEVVARNLAAADSVLGGQGLRPVGESVVGTLAAGADEEFPLEMRDGTSYVIIGVCDGGCTDIDLILSDASGRMIVEDKELDDVPVLSVAGANGTFTVKVEMATCSTEQCHYGVRVFQAEAQQ